MFPLGSKRFASAVHVPKKIVRGDLTYSMPQVPIAALPCMASIERKMAQQVSIPSLPDSYSTSAGSSFPVLRPAVEVVVPSAGVVSQTGSPAKH
ncbi:hypothetical protein JCM10212_000003 [Sporobolomyces blumeae]